MTHMSINISITLILKIKINQFLIKMEKPLVDFKKK